MNSNERYCDAIQVSYGVEVEAEVSGGHKNIFVFIPIVIGSKALNFKRSLNGVLTPVNTNNFTNASAPNDRKFNDKFLIHNVSICVYFFSTAIIRRSNKDEF